jgi:hypothetical protein
MTSCHSQEVITVCGASAGYGYYLEPRHDGWVNHGIKDGTVTVLRNKNGDHDVISKDVQTSFSALGTHYLSNTELRALRRLKRENPPSPHVFVSERGGPVTTAWFRQMLERLGERAGMPFGIHPHQLRHSIGHAHLGKDTRSLQAFQVIATFSPRFDIRPWHQIGSRVGKGSDSILVLNSCYA